MSNYTAMIPCLGLDVFSPASTTSRIASTVDVIEVRFAAVWTFRAKLRPTVLSELQMAVWWLNENPTCNASSASSNTIVLVCENCASKTVFALLTSPSSTSKPMLSRSPLPPRISRSINAVCKIQ